MTHPDLRGLLVHSRTRNNLLKVTGLLVFDGAGFMQILEGARGHVEAIFRSIEKDERHVSILVIHAGAIEQRTFSDWSMAFKRIDPRSSIQSWRDSLEMTAALAARSAEASMGCRFSALLHDHGGL